MLNRLRRFGFGLLYNECAFTYDLVSRIVSLGQWRCWQRSLFPIMGLPKYDTVLELAHGTGDLQVDLLEAGYRTVALDLSPTMGRITQRKLWRKGLHTPILRADVCQLPLKSSSFAAIVCTFPTSFVFQPDMLAELKRVLTPDGSADFVLSGQLIGGDPVKALIRGIYRVTGQESALLGEDYIHAFFGENGFDAQIEVVDCKRSQVQIVMLQKRPESS
ncbi:MAG: methyltransferase domain-containing protein [Chloroflexi bacterium]|nr:methyltransferase domain-containing protein [Chloroflexota bacterium]